jgi:type III restriction enzyme
MTSAGHSFQEAIQPVEHPILVSPYVEPDRYWVYEGNEPRVAPGRRPAGYYYKVKRTVTQQQSMFAEEQREDLVLVNALRADVKRWRAGKYEGATEVTKELLQHWRRDDAPRRLFFCQLEAVETQVYLNEILLADRRPRFRPQASAEDLQATLDIAPDGPTLRRLGIKMATGSGKTVVMAMLIAWAACNRGRVRADVRFPRAVLVCCPNLTIKERLQVLRPERADNYYDAFELVPSRLRPLLNQARVLITNWHWFAPESEHAEAGKTYRVVNKGEESDEAYAQRILGDLYGQGPLMVLNDEAHHAWRPPQQEPDEKLTSEQRQQLKAEAAQATVWIDGLDRLNRAVGIRFCADLSATPFYIAGSGHIEGSPYPWLVSDFGLVDAIECGIVKIPRLPVQDTTGRPEPRYFSLYRNVLEGLQPDEIIKGQPKPEAFYRDAEPALLTLAGQWVARYGQVEASSNTADKTPPCLIVICPNTDIAQVFYEHISGERTEEIEGKGKKKTKRTVQGTGSVFPEFFTNTAERTNTIRIDSKLLDQAESDDPSVSRSDAADQLRRIVATVGVPGEPGAQVRCVVSVAMLNEGWDAHNVTNILGVRAFDSQLLCEQVVGRGLRRMDYVVDPETQMLTEEYVDIYGVPFTLIPFKGRETGKTTVDLPKNHVHAVKERAGLEIRFPNVNAYAFELRRSAITADLEATQRVAVDPQHEPTAVFVKPRVTYEEGHATGSGPGEFQVQDRSAYYTSTHLQTIEFEIARILTNRLIIGVDGTGRDAKLRGQARHQLFPQVWRIVHRYIESRVNFKAEDPREIGQQMYVDRIVDILFAAIRPDTAQGETPLLPVLDRFAPSGTTADVDYKTVKTVFTTTASHINAVVSDTATWEQSAAFRLEQLALKGAIECYARNDELGLRVPYEFLGVPANYEPDYIVRLPDNRFLMIEIKGMETDEDRAKHEAARRWCDAVSNWGEMGEWRFRVHYDPQVVASEIELMAAHWEG